MERSRDGKRRRGKRKRYLTHSLPALSDRGGRQRQRESGGGGEEGKEGKERGKEKAYATTTTGKLPGARARRRGGAGVCWLAVLG